VFARPRIHIVPAQALSNGQSSGRVARGAMPAGGGGGGGGQAAGAVALGGALLGLAAYGLSQLDERKRQGAPDVQMAPLQIDGAAGPPGATGAAEGGGRLLVLWDMCARHPVVPTLSALSPRC
jgi:hypothetical protein